MMAKIPSAAGISANYLKKFNITAATLKTAQELIFY